MRRQRPADEAGRMYETSVIDGVLHLTRDDGAGYQIRRIGPALIEAAWVSSSGVSLEPSTAGPEDFLRQRPDVLVSTDCAAAIRSLAYS
jgi:hypothetical protein